jgi:2-polyprenyl-6-hydroxyphenyl methylase/3-demethylubiquinone-9 3-methyltransferase
MSSFAYPYQTAEYACTHAYLQPCLERLLAGVATGARVLDLGCGNGSSLAAFRGRDWILHGTDYSPSGIAIAQRNYPEIDFFVADASASTEAILERVGPVDIVISTEVIEHLYDPRGMLRNAFSVLEPGGVIILSTPYHGYLKNLLLALVGKMDQHFTVLWDHGHIKFWSKATLTKALEEAGFSEIRFEGAGRLPWLWKSMVLRGRKPLRSQA